MALLEASGIGKNFGETKVLKDISLTLEQGEALAIIGSSGSGKTTLLRCLNFLERPDTGVIRVNGETMWDAADPATQRESEVRKKRLHFGLVFQNFNLFPQYTALENVMLAGELLAKDHTVYTLDLLGCGRSDKPAITYTNFLYVQLIVTFIKQVIGCPTDVIASGLSGSFVVTACNTAPKCFGRIMMINPTDLAKLNKIPDKRSRFLKRMIELPLVGTLLYHTLTGRSNIELLFTESYYHNPFHRSPEDVDAFYESAHLQSSAGKYLFASLAGNYVNLNIGHALKHIDNSIFLIGGEEEPGIAETFALYTALNTSIETQILPKTKHMPQMEAPQALLDQIQIFFAPVQ